MTALAQLYRHSLALLTDLYQLTMANGYWKSGMADREAVFHLFFRRPPFGGCFAIACGLDYAVDFLREFRFAPADLDYLATLPGSDGRPLFEEPFLRALGELQLRCTIDAVPEGTAVFAHEPLVRVQGPLIECQLLETPLLNLINFQSLVATKAARVSLASRGAPVMEFGLRRAQGIDGGLAASRAAFVGGCSATSNVLAGKLFDIPVKGTHAHSWVMAFGDEEAAFQAYADAMPNNCVFLVDTYDTQQGTRRAAEVGRRLQARGHHLLGIRLDSGRLGELSREARMILDLAGLTDANILASSDLDEYQIQQLIDEGAPIDTWGVGTRLATAYDQPALGGVYKLGAIRTAQGDWEPRMKLSDEPAKSTTPGILQVRRYGGATFAADVIYDILHDGDDDPGGRTAVDAQGQQFLPPTELPVEELLIPITERGRIVYEPPSVQQAQARTRQQLAALPAEVRRLEEPQPYRVGLDEPLYRRRQAFMAAARRKT